MTTENEELKQRELYFGKARVNNEGINPNGFVDPELKYPKVAYSYESSVNKSARGSEVNNLSFKSGIPEVSLGIQDQVVTQYPLAQIDESLSGHVIEINDTPGGERVLIKHHTGAGIDLKPDGSVLINSKKNLVEIVGSDYRLSVDGDGDLIFFGNLNLTVTGDFNLNVKGDYNVNVDGDKQENISGSSRLKVVGSLIEIIQDSHFLTVLQQSTKTLLGGLNSIVKGSYKNLIEGTADYLHSGKTTITSEVGVNLSSPDINIAANSLSVFGDTGTIGGENIIGYYKNVYVGYNVKSTTMEASDTIKTTTFIGSLDGTAKGSNFAKVAGKLGNGSLPEYKVNDHDPNTDETSLPNQQLLNSYLTASGNGVRIIKIDPDQSLYNSINLSVNTGGVTSKELTVRQVRSKLKEKLNYNNVKFIQYAISNSKLSTSYLNPIPPSIGRVRGKQSTVTTGVTPIGTNSSITNLKRYRQSQSSTQAKTRVIIPPKEYNPQLADDIKMSTKLAPGIPISKFISSYGETTNLRHITSLEERKTIARNLYPQTEIIIGFSNLESFRSYNLVVAEGLYKSEETLTPGGIKDLATQGRVVAYELYDKEGNQAYEKLYDLAVWLKDNSNYDKLILNYDTYNPSNILNAQLLVVMPSIDENFNGVFNMDLETIFNGTSQSSSDLIEVI